MRISNLLALTVAAPIIAFSSNAEASTFVFEDNDGRSVNVSNFGGGTFDSVTTTFDEQSERLTWRSTLSSFHGRLANGGWLIINDGPDPRFNVQENTIFYMDGINEKLTAYSYDGNDNSGSWTNDDSTYLDSWDLNVEENGDKRTFSFDIDVSGINGRNDLGSSWEGSLFNDKVGIWFNTVNDLDIAYNDDGSIQKFDYSTEGWFGPQDQDTVRTENPIAESVPEPGTMAGLAVAGLLGAKHLRRRQQG